MTPDEIQEEINDKILPNWFRVKDAITVLGHFLFGTIYCFFLFAINIFEAIQFSRYSLKHNKEILELSNIKYDYF